MATRPVDRPPVPDLLDVQLYAQRGEHDAFALLRDERRVHFNPEPDGPGFYALTRYDDVVAAARDVKRFSSAKGTQIKDKRAEGHGEASVHNSDPPHHSRLRNAALPAFRRLIFEGKMDRFRRIVTDLLAATPSGAPFDFVDAVAVKLPMIVFAEVLGVPPADQDRMVFWANTMSDVLASEAEQASARAELFHYFRHLAALRRSDPQDDVASALVHAEVAGQPMNEGQLDAFFILLTVAGNETTRNLLSMGLEQLCLQQDDLARLRANPDLIPLTVEEMVRWVSPVIQMRRTATCDLDLHGTPIKAGDKVVLYFAAANRDERQFEAADRFRIDRTPNEHVGFGIGPHFCLGTHLARLETAAFLEVFLSRYQSCAIEGLGERLPSNWFAALKSLSVRWS